MLLNKIHLSLSAAFCFTFMKVHEEPEDKAHHQQLVLRRLPSADCLSSRGCSNLSFPE